MDANVQELTAKAEKLNIDSETPEYSTNWCNIPMEMRSECIEWMDLKTRMCLRRTSKTEKSLVKSAKKCRLDYLLGGVLSRTFEIIVNGKEFNVHKKYGETRDCQNAMRSIVNLLEHCEIGTFYFAADSSNDEIFEPIRAVLPRDAPFRFKTFRSSLQSSQISQFFLKNCEGVENISLNNYCRGGNLTNELIEIPAVVNAKFSKFLCLTNVDGPIFELVKKWIDNDAEIGKKLELTFDPMQSKLLEMFASIFKDRVISKDRDRVRIRTNNSTKHILLECDKMRSMEAFTCTIIPSDLLEFPADSEWAEEIHMWGMPSDSDSDSHSESELEYESD